jgi:5-keto 4-deoxyuronate isomerase
MGLDKFWSRTEIETLSRRLGYSVFDRGGGWWTMPNGIHSPSCRHRWVSKVVVKK